MIRDIDIPIYDAEVHFISAPSRRELNSWMKDMTELSVLDRETKSEIIEWFEDEDTAGQVFTLYHGHYAVCIKSEIGKDFNSDIHELFHSVREVLRDRGVEVEGVAEAYAYVMGYVAEQFYKGYKLVPDE